MSLSTKSIYPLFESVCVLNGQFLNASYHSLRFQDTFFRFFWKTPTFGLFDDIKVPPQFQKGKIKLRISYNQFEKTSSFTTYRKKNINSLKIIVDDTIDYDLKFEDRSHLNRLFQQRKNCDDILIIRNNEVTDTSYANIIFWDGTAWYTPTAFLLKGTKRSSLLESGLIYETTIISNDLKKYQGFQLINAMLDFDPNFSIPIKNIIS